MALSRDGTNIATAGRDGKVRLWDVKNAKPGKIIPAHAAACNNVAFTLDGNSIVSCAADGTIKQFDLASGNEIRKFGGSRGDVKSVACSPDGVHLACGDSEGIRLFNLKTGKQAGLLTGHKVPEGAGDPATALTIDTISYSADGRMLASEANDETARLWDVVNCKELKELPEHDGFVAAVNLSPDGRWGVSTRQGGRYRLWDAHTGQMKKVVAAHVRDVTCTAFSPDSRYLLTGGQDRTLRQWDVESGVELRRFQLSSIPLSVACAPDGRTAYTMSPREGVVIWKIDGAPLGAPKDAVKALDDAWDKLGSMEYEERTAAFNYFVREDPQAAAHIGKRLDESVADTSRGIQRALIAKLDDESYAVRTNAFHDLEMLGPAAREELIAVADRPSASTEVRLQAGLLLNQIGGRTDARRIVALEVLGVLGTPEAALALKKLAVLSNDVENREINYQARDILARLAIR